MDETVLRHDLNQMHGDDKWGHLTERLDSLLDAKDAEIAQLREAALDLLATATAMQSVIERAQALGKKPSRAAGSDTMFIQMLVDYEVSISGGRSTLLDLGLAYAKGGMPTDLRMKKPMRGMDFTVEQQLDAALDLLARRSMSCAGCCGPSAKEDEYEDYLREARDEVMAAARETVEAGANDAT